MYQILLILHVLACVGIVVLVLLQQGKGADIGAAFGSGSSNTMFGSQGALPFLVKCTAFLAVLFYVTSISFSYLTSHSMQSGSGVIFDTGKSLAVPPAVEGKDLSPKSTDKALLPQSSKKTQAQ